MLLSAQVIQQMIDIKKDPKQERAMWIPVTKHLQIFFYNKSSSDFFGDI